MSKLNPVWTNNGYTIRLARKEDAENYYNALFNPMDPEVVRLTGSKSFYPKEEVINFFLKCTDNEERYDFLILDYKGNIIGESVINEMDTDLRSANFRIAIESKDHRGKGLGTWATTITRDFAFEELKLHRLSLDVFSFNPRAQKTYEKAGFKVEGVFKDAVKDGDEYADIIWMAILEDEWKEIKEKENQPL